MRSFLLLLSGTLLFACTSAEKKLPIYGNREPVVKTVDGKEVTDTLYSTIPSFNFINQDSVSVTEADFAGKIYVADFFFTRCPSICPVMHRNMLKVYEKYKGNSRIKIASHTIDGDYDSPSILKKYAEKLGVNGTQWEFLNGPRDKVYQIAEKNYLVSVSQDPSAPGGYAHQGWFVLVDPDKRIRGAYDGTKPEQVDQLMADMDLLLTEYKK